MVRIYLDACCLSRLTDDQLHPRIRREAEAVEKLLSEVRLGTIELISSEALEDEVRRNPSVERRIGAQTLLSLASMRIEVDEVVAERARELKRAGYGIYDALHLAAAESAGADGLLSTDDRMIKRAARGTGNPGIPVQNPVSWSKE